MYVMLTYSARVLLRLPVSDFLFFYKTEIGHVCTQEIDSIPLKSLLPCGIELRYLKKVAMVICS